MRTHLKIYDKAGKRLDSDTVAPSDYPDLFMCFSTLGQVLMNTALEDFPSAHTMSIEIRLEEGD